ncbi:conserved hypothetical protein [Gammaproteobacteria bacterium]
MTTSDKHYELVSLVPNSSIILEERGLLVNLDAIKSIDFVYNDSMFNDKVKDGNYFWVSGGGSFLINGRYILLVKRGNNAKTNPGKFSLFNGRADNVSELINPNLVIRELFEELLLFYDKTLLYPIVPKYQHIIDKIYKNATIVGILRENDITMSIKVKLYETLLQTHKHKVVVVYKNKRHDYNLIYHINNTNDINVLFLLSLELQDVTKLTAIDGECYFIGNDLIRSHREIYVYDLFTANCSSIGYQNREYYCLKPEDMTEHLRYLLSILSEEITDDKK